MLPVGLVLWRTRIVSPVLQLGALILAYSSVELFVDKVIALFTYLSPLFGYAEYGDVTRTDLLYGAVDTSSNIAFYFWPVVDSTILAFSRRLNERFGDDGYRIYHNLFLIAAILQPVSLAWGFLPFDRALFYFAGMRMICLGCLLRYCLIDAGRVREWLVGATITGLFLVWFIIAISRGAGASAPYHF
jgi:hypothetical protein